MAATASSALMLRVLFVCSQNKLRIPTAALNDAGPTELRLQSLAELDTLIWFKFG